MEKAIGEQKVLWWQKKPSESVQGNAVGYT